MRSHSFTPPSPPGRSANAPSSLLRLSVGLSLFHSLPRRQRLHFDPAQPGRGPADVRTSVGTLEPRSERGEGPLERDFDARRHVHSSSFFPLKRPHQHLFADPAEPRKHDLKLTEPNLESGANIDCCKLYRDNHPVRAVPSLDALLCPTPTFTWPRTDRSIAGIRTHRSRINQGAAGFIDKSNK